MKYRTRETSNILTDSERNWICRCVQRPYELCGGEFYVSAKCIYMSFGKTVEGKETYYNIHSTRNIIAGIYREGKLSEREIVLFSFEVRFLYILTLMSNEYFSLIFTRSQTFPQILV
jgi:hypothetical protein